MFCPKLRVSSSLSSPIHSGTGPCRLFVPKLSRVSWRRLRSASGMVPSRLLLAARMCLWVSQFDYSASQPASWSGKRVDSKARTSCITVHMRTVSN